MRKSLVGIILCSLMVAALSGCGTTEKPVVTPSNESIQTYELYDIKTKQFVTTECNISGSIDNGMIVGEASVTDNTTGIKYTGDFVNGKLDGIVTIEGYFDAEWDYPFRLEFKEGVVLENMVSAVTSGFDYDFMVGVDMNDNLREQLHIYENEFGVAGNNGKDYDAVVIDDMTPEELTKHIGEIVKIENGSIYNFRYHTDEEIGMTDAAEVNYSEDKGAYAVFKPDIFEKFTKIQEDNGGEPLDVEVYGIYLGDVHHECGDGDSECESYDMRAIAVLDYKIK